MSISDKQNLPKHIAIIPDGNRRWAKAQGLQPWAGHEAGAQNTENLIRLAFAEGVECLTLWGSSLENLNKRPLEEKLALLDIYERYFVKLANSADIHQDEVKVEAFGRWREQFPVKLRKIIEALQEKTKRYTRKRLNFMLAYSGDDEMLAAIQKIVLENSNSQKITPEIVRESLWTKELSEVDLLIRTGGEPHLSTGFMMWHTRNVELYFSSKHFPDFKEVELKAAIAEYQERGRRKGA